MNLSDEEKRELLEFLYRFYYAWFTNNDGVLEDEARDAYRDIHALIEAPPPKYTMCENCLDDLEDEDNKFCYDDKCWQKLLDDCEAAEADLKKVRSTVNERCNCENYRWLDKQLKSVAVFMWSHNQEPRENRGPFKFCPYCGKGVEINPANNPDKVSGKEAKDGKEKD